MRTRPSSPRAPARRWPFPRDGERAGHLGDADDLHGRTRLAVHLGRGDLEDGYVDGHGWLILVRGGRHLLDLHALADILPLTSEVGDDHALSVVDVDREQASVLVLGPAGKRLVGAVVCSPDLLEFGFKRCFVARGEARRLGDEAASSLDEHLGFVPRVVDDALDASGERGGQQEQGRQEVLVHGWGIERSSIRTCNPFGAGQTGRPEQGPGGSRRAARSAREGP